jgi:hypothetical protein
MIMTCAHIPTKRITCRHVWALVSPGICFNENRQSSSADASNAGESPEARQKVENKNNYNGPIHTHCMARGFSLASLKRKPEDIRCYKGLSDAIRQCFTL